MVCGIGVVALRLLSFPFSWVRGCCPLRSPLFESSDILLEAFHKGSQPLFHVAVVRRGAVLLYLDVQLEARCLLERLVLVVPVGPLVRVTVETLGGGEVVLVLFVILMLFGGKGIPSVAKALGKGIREFKDATNGIQRDLRESTGGVTEHIQEQIQEVKKEIEKED